ncbi:MAG: hypothetical protein IPN29_02220 [Saprospiraceae bacterium]|nr:hypothetical protein [Saprospiraceae bacterium]
MAIARHGHAAIVHNNKIFVIGGYINNFPTGFTEEYDPNTDKWKTKSPMPTARGFFGLVAIDSFLYAIAGRIGQTEGPIEKYDCINDKWTEIEPLPVIRNRFGIAAQDNKVYIIGGEEGKKSLLIGNRKK